MKKVFYFDVETTGLDPVKQDIVQLAGYIEIDGEIKEQFNIFSRPFSFENINPAALEVSGLSIAEVMEFAKPEEMYSTLVKLFGKYVDKYDKNDKFTIAGYNVQFDIRFLAEFFKKNGDDYLFSYLNGQSILDPYPVLQFFTANDIVKIPSLELTEVCKHFGIELENAHNAMGDIEATKKVSEYITKHFIAVNEAVE